MTAGNRFRYQQPRECPVCQETVHLSVTSGIANLVGCDLAEVAPEEKLHCERHDCGWSGLAGEARPLGGAVRFQWSPPGGGAALRGTRWGN